MVKENNKAALLPWNDFHSTEISIRVAEIKLRIGLVTLVIFWCHQSPFRVSANAQLCHHRQLEMVLSASLRHGPGKLERAYYLV